MRPQVELLDARQLETIPGDAIRTLAKVGVFVENEDAMGLLLEAGMETREGRVLITEDAIQRALSTAPSEVRVYDRDGELALYLGGNNVHFDPGSAALWILDAQSGRRRAPGVEDVRNLAWVTQACRHVAAQSTGLIPADVPRDVADRYRLYIALRNCRKPVVTGTFLKDGFAVMREMLMAVRGGAEALRERPLAIFDCAPTPPLKWSDLTCQALIDCARAGIPAEMVSMPMAGATSPVTLREVVVQHCAECLSGVVIHQLACAGAPIIYGGSPSALDMRHGTTPMGAIETMMVDMAYSQVGKKLGLPTHAYMGLSDAKGADWQAGMESGLGIVLAALAGVNMISGPGMLDFESCQSLEKLLLDDQACGMALRLVSGITQRSEVPAPDLLQEVVEQGHFLSSSHTRRHFREELFMPGKVIDRGSYGDWEKRGAESSFEAARGEVARILARGNPAPLADEALDAELTRLIQAEAGRLGLAPLPA